MMRRRLQAVEAGGALLLAFVLVFVLPFRLLAGLMGASVPRDAGAAGDARRVASGLALARRVQRAAAAVRPQATCLVQAVALWLLLRRRGLDGHVRLGVLREGEALRAHAWVDVAGVTVLGGQEAVGYSAIADLGAGRDGAPRRSA
ncbi:MAG: lasso peptide biosynthesis B2 protein [Pseudomonadota bacterium]